ncbi:MAG: dihydroorotate dehydrogenase [Planctomycetota bacterium]|nr:MAG: dihydroorotate dehydrogenase [Planctomycetota bacterium]
MSARPSALLNTSLAGLALASPLVLAAGTAGVLAESADILDLSRIGAVVTKSITPEPRTGNAPWRVVPERAAMLNAIGLANPGIERFMREYATLAGGLACKVIASAAGFSIDDYERVVRGFAAEPALAAVELNVSCPNVHGGTEFGADTGALRELVSTVRRVWENRPLIVKLPPVTIGTPAGIVDLARTAVESGADALTLCNTIPAMSIDPATRRPRLASVTGGMSGPAIHPIITRLVHDVYQRFARDAKVPIIGLGGVSRWQDAASFILAGATAVGVGTGMFIDTRSPLRIIRGLERWAHEQRVSRISDLIGKLEAA